MKTIVIALIAGLLLTGCSQDPTSKNEPTPTYEMPLRIDATVMTVDLLGMTSRVLELDEPTGCEDMGGEYADLKIGSQIVLKDASGDTVSTADLKPGLNAPQDVCKWDATFIDIPAGGKFYTASIGEWESNTLSESDARRLTLVINIK